MKYGLLEYTTDNLGDEIQSLAAEQYLPRIDTYLKRDNLDEVESEEKIKLIMNGWFTHKPENWPPSPDIVPLFISFHIARSAADELVSQKSIDYFKKHEPIGCRDYHTRDLLSNHGVDAYFSGDLVLTLSKDKYVSESPDNGHSDDILLVDVDEHVEDALPKEIRERSQSLTHYFRSPAQSVDYKVVTALGETRKHLKKIGLNRPYRRMINLFENNLYADKTYNETKFDKARERLRRYANANLVITSRLHATNPCIAFDTPVLLVYDDMDDIRFGGLKDYFNCYSVDDFVDNVDDIDWNSLTNPQSTDKICSEMSERVEEFMN